MKFVKWRRGAKYSTKQRQYPFSHRQRRRHDESTRGKGSHSQNIYPHTLSHNRVERRWLRRKKRLAMLFPTDYEDKNYTRCFCRNDPSSFISSSMLFLPWVSKKVERIALRPLVVRNEGQREVVSWGTTHPRNHLCKRDEWRKEKKRMMQAIVMQAIVMQTKKKRPTDAEATQKEKLYPKTCTQFFSRFIPPVCEGHTWWQWSWWWRWWSKRREEEGTFVSSDGYVGKRLLNVRVKWVEYINGSRFSYQMTLIKNLKTPWFFKSLTLHLPL